VFSCLCGDSAYPRIVLGTTKWPSSEIESPAGPQETRTETTHGSPRKQAEERFRQLQDNYWKDLIELGSRPYQIETVPESAQELVRSILHELESTTGGGEVKLQIQEEVVDEGKTVPKTKAGKILEMECQKNRRYASITTREEKAVEKFIEKQLKEMDRQLKELATDKNTSSGPLKWLTKAFRGVCRSFSC
jgi:hypothetical protein